MTKNWKILFFISISFLLPKLSRGADPSVIEYETLKSNCVETARSYSCEMQSPLVRLVVNACEQRKAGFHCEALEKTAAPDTKSKFITCKDPNSICEDIASGTKSRIYSCGKSGFGVLVDAAKTSFFFQ